MNYDKRILKSGTLAVAVTIAFAIFISRAAEWSKGLNSEMIVIGQSTNSGGGGGIHVRQVHPGLVLFRPPKSFRRWRSAASTMA